VFDHNRYVSPDLCYDREGRPFQPQGQYFVGGATKRFGAALYRLRREDFGQLRHHDGISPARSDSLTASMPQLSTAAAARKYAAKTKHLVIGQAPLSA